MADSLIECRYVDDTGYEFRVYRREYYTDHASDFGFNAGYDPSGQWLPKSIKMRYVILYKSGDHRVVTIGNKTCAAWAIRTFNHAISLPLADGTISTGWIARAWYNERRIKDAPTL